MATDQQQLILCDLNKLKSETNNPFFDYFSLELAEKIYEFHKQIPGYEATPLQSLESLAKKLKLSKLWVKDESFRFGLNAYKFLGVSYALAKDILGPNDEEGI
jgi:diaminopropionate ammonia-lyase